MPGKRTSLKASPSPRSTPSRKKEHVALTLSRDVRFKGKTTGFEHVDFMHNALPEVNLTDVDTSTTFLAHTLRLPFMVSCMTGGYADALRINSQLAEVCEEVGIAMGVGSQRQALEDSTYHRSFSVARERAPSVPVVGNIGGAEVAGLVSADPILRLVDMLHADGFVVHLNPLQEMLQPEGNTDFRGVLKGIAMIVRSISIPVIVKEIGTGISASVARRLLEVGVAHIDVAGAGGTSWAGVETLRTNDREFAEQFWDWGIPTADALRGIVALRNEGQRFSVIASGGVSNGMDAAKCIALGADIVASARPLLAALHREGKAGVRRMVGQWGKTLRGVMYLTGSRSLSELQRVPLRTGASP